MSEARKQKAQTAMSISQTAQEKADEALENHRREIIHDADYGGIAAIRAEFKRRELVERALEWACRKLGSCAGWLPDYLGGAPEDVDFDHDTWKRWHEVALAQAKEDEEDE